LCLRHRLATVTPFIDPICRYRIPVYVLPKGFIPSYDAGFMFGITLAAQDISFDSMKEHQQALTRSDERARRGTMMSFTWVPASARPANTASSRCDEAALRAQASRWTSY